MTTTKKVPLETYTIVGASNNTEKYGHKVMQSLKELGFSVTPINPKEATILGEKAYPTLTAAQADGRNLGTVIFVVPPQVTESVLTEVAQLGIQKVWLQPGSENDKAIAYCAEKKINCIHHACIMIEKGHVIK